MEPLGFWGAIEYLLLAVPMLLSALLLGRERTLWLWDRARALGRFLRAPFQVAADLAHSVWRCSHAGFHSHVRCGGAMPPLPLMLLFFFFEAPLLTVQLLAGWLRSVVVDLLYHRNGGA